MQSRVHHLKFVIVADERRQRMALAETLQALELRAMACVNSQELLTGGLDNTKVMSDCVWLVDVADYGRLEEEIALFEPKLVLVGFNPAPDYGNANYEKWQRALTRKLSQALQSPALLKKSRPLFINLGVMWFFWVHPWVDSRQSRRFWMNCRQNCRLLC